MFTLVSCHDKNIIDDVSFNENLKTNLIQEPIETMSFHSDEMGIINLKSVKYRFNNNTVNLNWGNNEVATVYFDPDKYSIVIKKMTGLQFEMIIDNDMGKIWFKHDNEQRDFIFSQNGWIVLVYSVITSLDV